MPASKLTARSAAVLDAIVERHIATGGPVGSTAIAEQLPEALSPATIRNVMAELERLGLLEQPHTSAGRTPTRVGYTLYVGGLMAAGRVDGLDPGSLRERLETDPIEVRELLRRTCHLLAELSELVGVVSGPALADTVFQHIDFVALEGKRVLAMVVARSGQVKNRIVGLDQHMTQDQLDRSAAYLVRRFAGRSLRQVSARVREMLIEADQHLDRCESRAIRLGASSLTPDLDEAEVMVEGAASLLGQPDFDGDSSLQAMIETLEERRELRGAMVSTGDQQPRIFIGAAPLPAALGSCSMVAATYWSGGHALGSLAVLGPTRLDYVRTIALVDAMAQATSDVLGRVTL